MINTVSVNSPGRNNGPRACVYGDTAAADKLQFRNLTQADDAGDARRGARGLISAINVSRLYRNARASDFGVARDGSEFSFGDFKARAGSFRSFR